MQVIFKKENIPHFRYSDDSLWLYSSKASLIGGLQKWYRVLRTSLLDGTHGLSAPYCRIDFDHLVKVLFSLSTMYFLFSSCNPYYYSWNIFIFLLHLLSVRIFPPPLSVRKVLPYSFIHSFIHLPAQPIHYQNEFKNSYFLNSKLLFFNTVFIWVLVLYQIWPVGVPVDKLLCPFYMPQ